MIKAVVFDLAGVVLKESPGGFIKKGEKLLGKKATTNSCFDKKLCLGKSSLRAAFERMFGEKLPDQQFIALAKAWMSNWQLDEEMLELAKNLKKKNKIAILSNSEQSYEEKYDAELRKVFPEIFYSHRLRMAKPEKGFFEHALKKLAIQAEECIMVDDAKENEAPCKQLGIHFILFKNIEQLRKRLGLHDIKTPKAQKKTLPPIKIRSTAIMRKGMGETQSS